MIPITEQLNKFAEYLHNLKLTYGQKATAKKMLENLLGAINEREYLIQRYKTRINNCGTVKEYQTSYEKLILIMQCLDFDIVDIQMIEADELEFFLLNQGQIKKQGPITIERFKKFIDLCKYFYRTEHRKPQTIKELITKLDELKELRQQD